MPKHNQSASLGPVTDFVTPNPLPESERITDLERRLSTVEGLLNDVMHELDKPNTQPKSKQKPYAKPKSKQNGHTETPAERILKALGTGEGTRLTLYESCGLTEKAGNKAWKFLCHGKCVEKTGEQTPDGASLWKATEKGVKKDLSKA